MALFRGFGGSTDYIMLGAVVAAAALLAIFGGPLSWWLALASCGVILALIAWYRRKPRRS